MLRLLLFYEQVFFCFFFVLRALRAACLSEAAAASPAFITSPSSLFLLLSLSPCAYVYVFVFVFVCVRVSRPFHFCKVCVGVMFSKFRAL